MSIRDTIFRQIHEVAAQQQRPIGAFTDKTRLVDTGLDSLCLALLVASLDDILGLDPFSADPPFPVTVGDFVALYENA